jgi:hypothetical protein
MGLADSYKAAWTWPRPPSKSERQAEAQKTLNPFKLAAMLTPLQHLQFWCGW